MKHLIYNTVLLILLSLSIFSVKAQPSEPGYPAALIYQLLAENLPVITLPYFNNEELKAADTCETCSEAFGIDALAEFDFWQCHILSSSDNLAIWSIGINMPIPLNWPPPDYLKGQHYMLDYFRIPSSVTPPFDPDPYTCMPCRIQNNFYLNNCHSIHNLK